ncbi:MAG: HAD hydrolase-like protein [Verrucomicrobia bacterium]|nr:HAD hydrolase-like protein [Verrucomicrobiota bacterium]MCH8512929.1 HAD hydrolase-like protein [Kiritimatiellia bacterium]
MLFKPRHDFLIGIDSDGCVFDSMEAKQTLHFHPLIIRHWGLKPIEPELRAVAEYVNLRSPWRGSNRFLALLKTFEFLDQWEEAHHPLVSLPDYKDLCEWIHSGDTLNHDALAVRAKDSPELKRVLEWSNDVNRDIAENLPPPPPFDGAADTLSLLHARADAVVISLTPLEALLREWKASGLRYDVDAIAGQEWGTKPEQIRLAMSQGTYNPDHVLIIGDAPGDLKAAKETGVAFFPIIPGREVQCWRQLLSEDMDLFFSGKYRGKPELDRIGDFEAVLNEPPPWA